jgi:hypothetical protein
LALTIRSFEFGKVKELQQVYKGTVRLGLCDANGGVEETFGWGANEGDALRE